MCCVEWRLVREKVRPAGWASFRCERKFALHVQNGRILPILCVLGEFCTGWGAGGVLLGEFCTGWGWEYGCAASSGVWCERKFALLAGLASGARESSPCMSKMGEFCRFCVCWVSFVPVGAGGVLLGEFCTGWGAGGVLLGEFCNGRCQKRLCWARHAATTTAPPPRRNRDASESPAVSR